MASRWIAGFLMLVMLAPASAPLAMACSAQTHAHCMRQPLSAQSAQNAQPEMPCHRAMAHRELPPATSQSGSSGNTSSELSFQSDDNDCCDHHCCCGALTSEWEQPAYALLHSFSIHIEIAPQSSVTVIPASEILGKDSTRAPPLTVLTNLRNS